MLVPVSLNLPARAAAAAHQSTGLRQLAVWQVPALLWACLSTGMVWAEEPAGAASPSLRNAGALQLEAQAPPQALRLQVQRYEVLGNSLLAAELLVARLTPFEGERSWPELQAAAASVQALYREAGFGAVLAFLPEQSLQEGVVRIQVVEGKLEGIEVSGQQHFSQARILAGLSALRPGQTPAVRQIDAQIQMLNENPARNVQVLLQPGSSSGLVAAKVTVQESPLQRWTARLDNTGNASSGRLRAALGFQHADVWGMDHVMGLDFQTAPQHLSKVAVLSGSYRIPMAEHSLALDAFAAWSNVDSGTSGTAAGDLQFNGEGRIAGLRLQRYLPRWGELDQRLILGLEQRSYLNDCRITGLPAGACGASGASVTLQPLSLSYIAQANSPLPMGLHLSLHRSLALGGTHGDAKSFADARPGASQRYTVLRTQVHGGVALPADWRLSLRVSGQMSNDALVAGEQFGIGGAQSVRGYTEREFGGDIGAQAALELLAPNLGPSMFQQASAELRGLAFVDGGWVHNRLGLPCRNGGASGGGTSSDCSLASVGLGLRLNWAQWQARLDLARALNAGALTAKGSNFAHFALNYSF